MIDGIRASGQVRSVFALHLHHERDLGVELGRIGLLDGQGDIERIGRAVERDGDRQDVVRIAGPRYGSNDLETVAVHRSGAGCVGRLVGERRAVRIHLLHRRGNGITRARGLQVALARQLDIGRDRGRIDDLAALRIRQLDAAERRADLVEVRRIGCGGLRGHMEGSIDGRRRLRCIGELERQMRGDVRAAVLVGQARDRAVGCDDALIGGFPCHGCP